jgi:hypothetical protein
MEEECQFLFHLPYIVLLCALTIFTPEVPMLPRLFYIIEDRKLHGEHLVPATNTFHGTTIACASGMEIEDMILENDIVFPHPAAGR